MPSFGFIQAGYATRGLAADVQRWVNLYIEKTESGQGANHDTGFAAYCTPGKQLLCQLDDQPISCVKESNAFFYSPTTDLYFVMSGSTLYAIRATFDIPSQTWVGSSAVIGTGFLTLGGLPGGALFPSQIIVITPTLLFVVSGGGGYVAAYGQALATSSLNFGGTAYAVGDTGTIPVNGGIPAQYIVTSVGAMGVVTGYTITYNGTGYSVSLANGTTTGGAQPGVGSGLTIDVNTVSAAAWLVQQQTIPYGTTITDNFINTATWQDGYVIISLAPNEPDPQRREFFISGINDPTTWNPLDFATKEANSDPNVAVFAAAEILGLFGSQQIELWQNTGNVLFPFQRLPGGGVLEYGLAQRNAITKFHGTVAYLSTDARGQYVMRMIGGPDGGRISNHAIENHWSLFDTAGCTIYSYTENGHEFLVCHFPIPNETWVYDHGIGPALGWHERAYWDGSNFSADIGRYHGFFPEIGHCVGDYRNGNLYLQSLQFLQDNCQTIRRIRVAPHLVHELHRNVYDRVKLHCLTGRVPATGPGSDPVCSIKISHTGGQSYGPLLTRSMGKIGEFKKIIEWFHLGYGRDTVFWWECDEPIDIVLVDMYADYRPGFN